MTQINKDFNFKSKINKGTIESHSQALKHYKDTFLNVYDLKGNTKLFLDTNVLIHIYKISFKARNKLFNFLEKNVDRVFLTHQIQEEFIRNREKSIDDFYSKEANSLPNNFKASTINQLESFLEKNQTILVDFDFIEKKIIKIKKECEAYLEKLKEKIAGITQNHQNDKFDDSILKLYQKFSIADCLSEEEITFLKKEFDSLAKDISEHTEGKIKTYSNRAYKAFPGMGDLVEKSDNPYGDYYIYHEMLKFVKDKDEDIVFLTFDTTKGDWLKVNKEPHVHYIETTYLNTNRSIIILDAERTFEDILDISFKSITEDREQSEFLDLFDKDIISTFLFKWAELENLLRSQLLGCGVQHVKLPTNRLIEQARNHGIVEVFDIDILNQLKRHVTFLSHGDYEDFLRLNEFDRDSLMHQLDEYIRLFK